MLCTVVILLWPVAVRAATMSFLPAEPTAAISAKPAQGLGQLVVRDAQSDSPVRLNVASYHAHVVLQPPVALVQIDQSFYNPFGRQEEGTFVFNLPRGASVSRFAMYVAPGALDRGRTDRAAAGGRHLSIDRRPRSAIRPFLSRSARISSRCASFPIPPKGIKRILLDYTIPLESSARAVPVSPAACFPI